MARDLEVFFAGQLQRIKGLPVPHVAPPRVRRRVMAWPDDTLQHGTAQAYNVFGCRCIECRRWRGRKSSALRARQRAYFQSRRRRAG